MNGVIIAATHHIEFLLPWWLHNFRAHNDFPLIIFDIGMSEKARKWCSEREEVVSLTIPETFIVGKEKVDSVLAHKWEATHGDGIWEVRLKWFKKPFVFAHSPFSKTLWIDLDCEVRASLHPLFDYCENEMGIAMTREPEAFQKGFQALGFSLPGETIYNSGVVAYSQNAPVLSKWMREVEERNHCYISDQEALSRVLFAEKKAIKEFPPEYNWDRGLGENIHALVFHWHGQKGKKILKSHIDQLSQLNLFDYSF